VSKVSGKAEKVKSDRKMAQKRRREAGSATETGTGANSKELGPRKIRRTAENLMKSSLSEFDSAVDIKRLLKG
jgi:hypothetical protein